MVIRRVFPAVVIVVAASCAHAGEAEHGEEALLAQATQLNKQLLQHFQRGEYRQAAEAGEQALAIRRRLLGDRHTDTATSIGNLGAAYVRLGDYVKAEPLLVQQLQIRKETLGDRHSQTVTSLNNLGELYRRMGRYAKAEGLLQQSLDICRALHGEAHPQTANVLNTLGHIFQSMGRSDKAEPLFLESLSVTREVYGNDHPRTAMCLDSLAVLRQAKGQYAKAAALCTESLAIFQKTLGEKHPSTAHELKNLATVYCAMGKYKEAEPLYRKALENLEDALGREHPSTADAIRHLGEFYISTGQYAKAEPLFRRGLEWARARLGPEHRDTTSWIYDLAVVYEEMGEYAKAEPLYRQSLEIRENALGADHPDTIQCLSGLGTLCQRLGRMDEAESLLRKAWETQRRVLGEEHPDTAESLNGLARLHSAMGQYAKAGSEYRRSLEIRKKAFGDEHPKTAESLNNLATFYVQFGEYREAEPLYRESLRIAQKVFGRMHLKTANTASNLGELYRVMGDCAEAEQLFRQALRIRWEALGPQHPDTATSLNNLGLLLQQTGDQRAEQVLAYALKVVEKAYGAEHPTTAISLNNLALVYQARGDRDQAEPLLQRSLAINEKAFGDVHLRTARSVSNLASFYRSLGEWASAEPMCRRALKIRRQILGDQHPDIAASLVNLALILFGTNRFSEAEAAYGEALAIYRRHLDRTFDVLTERQRLLLNRQSRNALNGWLSAAERAGVDDTAIYQRVLRWKGIVHARQVMERIAFEDPALATRRERLRAISSRLSTLAMTPPETLSDAVRWLAGMSVFTEEKERLERELARASSQFRASSEAREITPAVLGEALPAGTALVDFLEYIRVVPENVKAGRLQGVRTLVAFVVVPGRPVVKVNLGDRQTIGLAIWAWRDGNGRSGGESDAGGTLRRRVWLPIQDHLGGVTTVLVSPDGPLHALPFAGLPGPERGTYLIDEYAFATIAVPALLPMLGVRSEVAQDGDSGGPETDVQRTPSLLVIGDVDYGGDPGMTIGSTRQGASGTSRPDPLRDVLTTLVNRNIQREVLAVRTAFQSRFPDGVVHLLRRKDATESAFRKQAPKHQWLHIATHGCFAGDNVKSAVELALGQDAVSIQHEDRSLVGYHPGLLSGLALTGADRRAGSGQDDGILTALEVQTMDLSHVDMAVLSACDTGRGKVAGGEGVLGLQRAFQIAGVKATVATLWDVGDFATSRIMGKFYENVWERDMTKIESLRDAQRWWMREGLQLAGQRSASNGLQGDRLPPKYWAGYVLAGAWQ